MQEKTKFYIGYSTDNNDREKVSSGGIGTTITRYLLDQHKYGTSITFAFDKKKCMYAPELIYTSNKINNCGSIYQDIDIFKFIKDNINNIKDGVIVTCLPCQVASIRKLLENQNIENFIISFSCSGQTTIEGTWCYYRLIGIKKEEIENMQYRGNGWPSGIQIWTRGGEKFFYPNYAEPWKTIHQSALFRPTRCHYCKKDTSWDADISLADPWLKSYIEKDNMGHTLFLINTQKGTNIFNDLVKQQKIKCKPSNYDEYAIAQRPNIGKELKILKEKQYIKKAIWLKSNNLYHQWATGSLSNMQKHLFLLRCIRIISNSNNINNLIKKRWQTMLSHIRILKLNRRLGAKAKFINIQKGVIINNPQCVYIGKHVGIGSHTFIGPVIEYAQITYNPKIIIGDGTWIGKHCSIAAINKVEIGRNVLFAGYVHITDHSHGYEDISCPIAPQRLTSKGAVIIEDDCWLGFNCEILSGVHIGKHCIIAARAVVTKDVPSYSIAAGNPARIVKQYNFKTQKWEKTKQ